MNGGQSCPGNDTETARACYTPCPGKFASRLTLFAIGSKKRDYIFDLIWIWFKHQILLRFYLGWLLGLLLLFGLTSQVMLKFDRKLYKGYTFFFWFTNNRTVYRVFHRSLLPKGHHFRSSTVISQHVCFSSSWWRFRLVVGMDNLQSDVWHWYPV